MAPASDDLPPAGGAPGGSSSSASGMKASTAARHYSRIVDDESRSEKEREAALLYTVAESRLDGEPEDLEETIEVAERARALFQELGDPAGLAHTRRLLSHCRRLARAVRSAPAPLAAAAPAVAEAPPPRLDEPEDALDELWAGDRAKAASLLDAAERQLREGNAEQARSDAVAALPALRRLGDQAAVASALLVLVRAACEEEGEEAAVQMAREELERCVDTENPHGEAAMLLSLAEVLCARGGEASAEALRVGTEAQEILQQLGDQAMEATALLALTKAYAAQRNAKEAMRAAGDAIVLFRGLGDTEGEVLALHGLARAYRLFERPQDALRWARLAGTRAREVESGRLAVLQLCLMAELSEAGDRAGMLRDAREAAERAQAAGLRKEEGEALLLVLSAHSPCEKLDEALSDADRALQRFRALAHREGQAVALDVLSQCHLLKHDSERALECANDALTLIRELQDKQWESEVLNRISSANLNEQKLDDAGKAAEDAIAMMRSEGDSQSKIVDYLYSLFQVHSAKQEWDSALQVLSKTLGLVRELGDREREAHTLHAAASLYLQLGRHDESSRDAAGARRIYEELGDIGMWVQSLHVLSQVSLARGEFRQAVREAEEAMALIRRDRKMYKREELTMLLHLNQVHHSALLNFRLEGGTQDSRTYTDLVAKVDRGAMAAVKVATELGEKEMMAVAKFRFGQASLLSGRFAEALAANETAMELFRESGDQLTEGSCACVKSQVLQALGRLQEALDCARRAKAIGQSCRDEALEEEASGQVRQLEEELQLPLNLNDER